MIFSSICRFCFLWIIVTSYVVAEEPAIDLEAQPQTFVLESKRIYIPQYPDAFNPSIIRKNNKLLMSFRIIENPKDSYNTSRIGLVWLNDNFEPVGNPQILNLHGDNYSGPNRAEDARLIDVAGRLLMVFSDNEDVLISKGGFRVFVAELIEVNGKFCVMTKDKLVSFEGANSQLREKNWTPFDYERSLFLSYSLEPHVVFEIIPGFDECSTICKSSKRNSWSWGELRGGTQSLKVDDQYLTFFHSCTKMASKHSQGKEILHYFMGACTFFPKPPFEMAQISPEPIIDRGFFSGPVYKPYWGSWRGVFPCGFVFDNNYIWVLYGQQNHELWMVKLDKKGLLDSLVPVSE